MKYNKAQISVFILIGAIILVLLIFASYITRTTESVKILDNDKEQLPIKDYIDGCYSIHQKCLLLKAGIIEDFKEIGFYKTYFKNFIMRNSLKCTYNLPDEINKDFIGDKSVTDVVTILPKEKTIFVLETGQKIIIDEKTEKEIGNYMQEHDVGFMTLHNHTKKINENNKVSFDYLKEIPIDQTIYRQNLEKQYIINDTISEINFRGYLFLFKS